MIELFKLKIKLVTTQVILSVLIKWNIIETYIIIDLIVYNKGNFYNN